MNSFEHLYLFFECLQETEATKKWSKFAWIYKYLTHHQQVEKHESNQNIEDISINDFGKNGNKFKSV